MHIYIVVTEDSYGGEEKVKVFLNQDDAQKYADTFEKVDTSILECDI